MMYIAPLVLHWCQHREKTMKAYGLIAGEDSNADFSILKMDEDSK